MGHERTHPGRPHPARSATACRWIAWVARGLILTFVRIGQLRRAGMNHMALLPRPEVGRQIGCVVAWFEAYDHQKPAAKAFLKGGDGLKK